MVKERRLYRHFKGTLYEILHRAFSSSDPGMTTLVVYRAVSLDGRANTNNIWVRKESEFEELVEWPNGKQDNRFLLETSTNAAAIQELLTPVPSDKEIIEKYGVCGPVGADSDRIKALEDRIARLEEATQLKETPVVAPRYKQCAKCSQTVSHLSFRCRFCGSESFWLSKVP